MTIQQQATPAAARTLNEPIGSLAWIDDRRKRLSLAVLEIESATPPAQLNPALRQEFYAIRNALADEARHACAGLTQVMHDTTGRPPALAPWELQRLAAHELLTHAGTDAPPR